jgi:drug/metabolite transporter (DMT)-like permease
LLNGLNGILIIFSNPHVAGVVQSALSQVVIPVTLMLSVCYLGASFSHMMYAGALIIFAGVAIELAPSLFSALHEGGNEASTSGFWALAFVLGQVPAALCSIYQEQAFTQGVRVNVVLMMAWSSLAQFVFLLVAVPLDWIPGFGTTTPSGFANEMWDAVLCTANRLEANPECSNAAVVLACCIATMLFTNVFQALLVKHSSAALAVLVLTLIPWLMGPQHTEQMSGTQIAALAVLMTGVCVYRYADVTSEERVRAKTKSRGESMPSNTDLMDVHTEPRDPRSSTRARANSDPHSRRPTRGQRMRMVLDQRAREQSARAPLLMPTRCGIIACEVSG